MSCHLNAQVLPDNAYELRQSASEADAAQPNGAEALEFGQSGEPPIRQTSPPAQRDPGSNSDSNGRKRVRFAAYVPLQRRSTDDTESAQVHVRPPLLLCHTGHQRVIPLRITWTLSLLFALPGARWTHADSAAPLR